MMDKKKSSPEVAAILEDILGCKWSLSILSAINAGVCRPGALTRHIDGLTTKVLNERLKKMVRYTILIKKTYPEVPPRVEYELTEVGRRIGLILDEVIRLQRDLNQAANQELH